MAQIALFITREFGKMTRLMMRIRFYFATILVTARRLWSVLHCQHSYWLANLVKRRRKTSGRSGFGCYSDLLRRATLRRKAGISSWQSCAETKISLSRCADIRKHCLLLLYLLPLGIKLASGSLGFLIYII